VILEIVTRGVSELLNDRDADVLLGVGIGMSGQNNAATDTFTSLIWHLDESTLREQLEDVLHVPVVILDNAHAAVMGELWLHGREYREHLMYFYMGVGTGGAIVTGRDLYLGRTHTAGEIGQSIVDIDGPDFGCHRGCLEGFLSYGNLRRVIAERRESGTNSILPLDLPDHVIVGEIAAAADRGDDLALYIIGYCSRYVGVQAANMLALLNPDEIILGGPFAAWGRRFKAMVVEQVRQIALKITFDADAIKLGEPATTTIPLGAAAITFKRAPELLAPTARELANLAIHENRLARIVAE
jgi:glucokinase